MYIEYRNKLQWRDSDRFVPHYDKIIKLRMQFNQDKCEIIRENGPKQRVNIKEQQCNVMIREMI